MNKEISENGLKFITKEEGVVLHPYLDSVKVATIGVGSTFWENGNKVKITDKPITKERAIQLFKTTVKQYEAQVNKSITADITQNQFDALVSLCYNIGVNGFKSSTLVKKINEGATLDVIEKWLLSWKNAGGKPILLSRRKREYALYIK